MKTSAFFEFPLFEKKKRERKEKKMRENDSIYNKQQPENGKKQKSITFERPPTASSDCK
jgi:hypothetical protein